MVYIRTDANKIIASGHVMRCAAIAGQIQKMGVGCTFIVADHESEKLVVELGFPCIVLNTRWDGLEDEIGKLLELIKERHIERLLVDSYFANEKYVDALSRHTKTIYIDDLDSFHFNGDVLVNYSLNYRQFRYGEKYRGPRPKLLLGEKYIPLREEFSRVQYIVGEKVENILITTGGADLWNISGRLLKKAVASGKYPGCKFHVISGKFNENINELREIERTNSNIIIYENVKNMSDLMSKCDIAITAKGTTVYELCAVGVPFISFSFADNQSKGAAGLDEGLIEYAGDLRKDVGAGVERIFSLLDRYCESSDLRLESSERLRKLVDGFGAKRIAEHILLC